MTSLRRRMTEDMQVRNLSLQTQATYVQQVSLFARHFNKSPEILGPEEIRSYQVYLTNERKLAPSSIIIAVAALRFLYKITLHRAWNLEEVIPTRVTASRAPQIPAAMTHPFCGRKPMIPLVRIIDPVVLICLAAYFAAATAPQKRTSKNRRAFSKSTVANSPRSNDSPAVTAR